MMTHFSDLDTLFGFTELDRAFDLLDALRRDSWPFPGNGGGEGHLRADLWDTGEDVVFQADVPGMTDKDVQVTVNQDILTITASRQVTVPEGYKVYRRERPQLRFSRSYRLPYPTDGERVHARVQHGVLTVTLPKAAEAKPRRIAIQGQ